MSGRTRKAIVRLLRMGIFFAVLLSYSHQAVGVDEVSDPGSKSKHSVSDEFVDVTISNCGVHSSTVEFEVTLGTCTKSDAETVDDCTYYVSYCEELDICVEFDEDLFTVYDGTDYLQSGDCSTLAPGTMCDCYSSPAMSWYSELSIRVRTGAFDECEHADKQVSITLMSTRWAREEYEGSSPCNPSVETTYFDPNYIVVPIGINIIDERSDLFSCESTCPAGGGESASSCQPEVGQDSNMNDGPSFGFPGEGGGCASCPPAGGGGNNYTLQAGNATVTVGPTQDQTLNFFATVSKFYKQASTTVNQEVNLKGQYFPPNTAEWTKGSVNFDTYESGGTHHCTQLDFTLTDKSNNDVYRYEVTGDWTSTVDSEGAEYAACVATEKRIRLRDITNGETTKATYTYDTTGTNNMMTLHRTDNSTNVYIIYEGGVDDANKPDEPIKRIWIGSDPDDFAARGDSPDGGRWLDIDCELSSSGEYLITKVTSCGACGGATRSYEYTEARAYRRANGDPIKYLISAKKDASNSVLLRYEYDNQDRKIEGWLGDYSKKVVEWDYRDGIREIEDNSGRELVQKTDDIVIRRDYVDDDNYRANVFYYNGSKLVEKRIYHDLQSDLNPTGSLSQTLYTYERNASGNLTKKIVTHPDGSKFIKYYDNNLNVTKQSRQDLSNDELVEMRYQYQYIGAISRYVVTKSTDLNGAATEYSYDSSGNLLTQYDPDPETGGKTANSLTTIYDYDSSDMLTKQTVKGTREITSEYEYDGFDRMTKEIAGGLTTTYSYNIYNNVTKTEYPGGSFDKYFYNTDTGILHGKARYANATTAVSGEHYEYDSNGRITKTSIVVTNSSITGNDLTNLEADLIAASTGSYSDWVHTSYLYDSFGRKTANIADSGGNNLTTSFDYDYLSNVTKVTRPDGSSSTTVYDGRGKVKYKIATANSKSATTSYVYNANGNLEKQEDPEGVCKYYEYDGFGRMTRVRNGR